MLFEISTILYAEYLALYEAASDGREPTVTARDEMVREVRKVAASLGQSQPTMAAVNLFRPKRKREDPQSTNKAVKHENTKTKIKCNNCSRANHSVSDCKVLQEVQEAEPPRLRQERVH